MSNVSRSVYQQLKEENKKLLRDISVLVMDEIWSDTYEEVRSRYRKKIREDQEFMAMLKEAAIEYMKNNPQDEAVKSVKKITESYNAKKKKDS